ncbi:MAG TPA: response regulator, partial [Desulfatiglandales bacterium]|nr:response regulator [Desulfatiglandales bacterium]
MKQKFPILIVEDDLVSQRLLEKAFIHAGYEVTSAENGRKALECFDKTFFPIVVTDWIMPEMDGLELCRAIRKRTDKGYVFIILLTSKDSTGDIISGLESGADDYLTKPFSYDELIARLNTGIRILKLEDSLKGVEREIRRYNEHLEDMVAERTENLRKSEEKYRTILENIEDGYYEIDIAGNFIFFNDALCNITGYPGNELMGMNLSRLANQDNTRSGHQVFQEVYAKGVAIKDFNWEFTKMDGSARHAEASISLIRDREGKGTGFRGIIRDISKRKKLEHELIEKKRLAEEASKAKSEFLANISHEIRTPLNGIIGMAEWVMETDLNNDQRDIFHAINTEADSLLGIINDILDLCKIESGKLELEEIPFDLRALFEDMANSFAIRAEKKGLEFISFLSPDVPSQLIGDPGRLRQILLNLGDNALKFTHEGEIYIKGEVAEDFEHKVKLRFLVKDTGIGIPKEKQEIIFESFRQADGSTTRNYGGTGLGTTISKELAEMNGGEIFVESEEGKGSTFCFTAIYTKQKERKPILRKEEVNLSNLKALIVDDNEKNRFILTEYLNLWGCCSLTASGGREALSMLKNSVLNNEPVQLILTDLQMPEMDGFSLVIEIKKEKDLKDIPVIALDSLARRGNGKSCRDIGIAGYLTKPIKKDDLHKVI